MNLRSGKRCGRDPWPGNVMLVDDCDVDRMQCERLLNRFGRQIGLAPYPTARGALADLLDCAARNRQPDLLLLDVHMPAMDGFEFLEAATNALGEALAGVQVVMMTDALAEADRQRAAGFRAVRLVLGKPLCESDLDQILGLTAIHATN